MPLKVLSNLPILGQLFQSRYKRAAEDLYRVAGNQARDPVLFTEFGVPDTVEGRYEMLTLHVALVMRRLGPIAPDGPPLSQALFDVMFDEIDAALREMGVGDTRVGKKVRTLAEDLLGRADAYDAALSNGDEKALADAIARNVFTSDDGAAGAQLAAYASGLARGLDAQSNDDLVRGRVELSPATQEEKGEQDDD